MATSYSYDALNRLTDIAYPDAALNVHFSYDAQGCASAASAGCAGAADVAASAWFDQTNQTRELLSTTVRSDLPLIGLLVGWRDVFGG